MKNHVRRQIGWWVHAMWQTENTIRFLYSVVMRKKKQITQSTSNYTQRAQKSARHTESNVFYQRVKNVAQNAHVVNAQMHVLIRHKWNGIESGFPSVEYKIRRQCVYCKKSSEFSLKRNRKSKFRLSAAMHIRHRLRILCVVAIVWLHAYWCVCVFGVLCIRTKYTLASHKSNAKVMGHNVCLDSVFSVLCCC